MFHAIRLAKVVYISLLAFSTRPLLSPSSPVERIPTQKAAANMIQINAKKHKNRTRAHYRYGQRRALAISDYLVLAAPLQHTEATHFINQLEEKYPHKKDVRKTPEFRQWQRNQLGINNDKSSSTATNNRAAKKANQAAKKATPGDTRQIIESKKEMILNIRLMDATQSQEIPQPIPQVSAKPGAEGSETTSIFDQIPDHVMNQMLKDINDDPYLKSILDEFDIHEEIIDEGNVSDIDIDGMFPLEEELNKLF